MKHLHLGEIFRQICTLRNMEPKDLAPVLCCHVKSVYKLFKRENWNTDQLNLACKALKFDFYKEISVQNQTNLSPIPLPENLDNIPKLETFAQGQAVILERLNAIEKILDHKKITTAPQRSLKTQKKKSTRKAKANNPKKKPK